MKYVTKEKKIHIEIKLNKSESSFRLLQSINLEMETIVHYKNNNICIKSVCCINFHFCYCCWYF